MATTYLQLVNKVLLRLREDSVASVSTSDYSQLIGEYVNLAKDEIEQRHNWVQLRDTIRILTVPGTFAYELPSLGFQYEIQEVWNDTKDYEIKYGEYEILNRYLNENTLQSGDPYLWDINGNVNDDPIINLWPVPNAAQYINVNAAFSQAELTADATEIIIPWRPVVEHALMLAMEERGEDDGSRYEMQVRRTENITLKYIHMDMLKWPEYMVWEVE